MKGDMAGGAAVLGAAESISQIQPEGVEVCALIMQHCSMHTWPMLWPRATRKLPCSGFENFCLPQVHFILPAAENMIDGSGTRPSVSGMHPASVQTACRRNRHEETALIQR